MTKVEMVAKVYEALDGKVTKKDAEKAMEALFDSIKGEFLAGKDVTVSKFGTFKVKTRSAHDGRNPKTGESIHIEAQKTVTFKPVISLKSELNAK